jgi:hypothetical protein
MMRSCVLMPLLLAAVSGTCLGANEFSYQIKVGTGAWSTAANFNASTATTINVGTVGASDVYLRIYDNNVATLNDLGRITITGTSAAGGGRLKIAVWRDFSQDFPTISTSFISAVGAASWNGLTFNDPGSSNNTNLSLLKRTDLAASIRDNLNGNVDVGRVFTLQVNGTLQVSGAVVGGNIDGQVRAWSEDEFAPSPAFDDPPSIASIEYVRAGNRITKKIIAGDTDQSSEGYVGSDYDTIEELLQYELAAYPKGDWLGRGASIRRVVIGPSTQSEGMINDGGLDASTGRIYRVTSTGKIGEREHQRPRVDRGDHSRLRRLHDQADRRERRPGRQPRRARLAGERPGGEVLQHGLRPEQPDALFAVRRLHRRDQPDGDDRFDQRLDQRGEPHRAGERGDAPRRQGAQRHHLRRGALGRPH